MTSAFQTENNIRRSLAVTFAVFATISSLGVTQLRAAEDLLLNVSYDVTREFFSGLQ
ncbi:MAG TPA: hypothetical protein VFG14_06585 [Chthoniobacteraceae bacterium]|nr:hypothetical protein [Chthoniobacteraceae bacterium]